MIVVFGKNEYGQDMAIGIGPGFRLERHTVRKAPEPLPPRIAREAELDREHTLDSEQKVHSGYHILDMVRVKTLEGCTYFRKNERGKYQKVDDAAAKYVDWSQVIQGALDQQDAMHNALVQESKVVSRITYGGQEYLFQDTYEELQSQILFTNGR
jgi:hypothetical protein